MEFFDAPRPAAGALACRLDLPGLAVRVQGMDEALQRALCARLGPHMRAERPGEAAPALDVALGVEDRDYFIPPPETPGVNPVGVALQAGLVRYVGHRAAGWFESEKTPGSGVLLLARGEYEPPERAIENYLRVSGAWRAIGAGGAVGPAAR